MRPILIVVLTVVVGACGPTEAGTWGERPAPEPAVRDSLGVSIVEYSSLEGADSASWQIVMPDTVRFGKVGMLEGDPAYSFGRTWGNILLSDGRVAIADRLAPAIRIFLPDGSIETSVGRRGEGPGEFVAIQGMYRIGSDSILAFDRGNRWSLFQASGRFVRSGLFDLTAWAGDAYPVILGAFADGTLLVSHGDYATQSPFPGIPDVVITEYANHFFRADRFGTPLADFGVFPGGKTIRVEGRFQQNSNRVPRMWSTGLNPLHSAQGSRFFQVNEGLREVQIYARDGALERILRVAGDALEIDGYRYLPSMFPADIPIHARRNLAEALQTLNLSVGPSPFSDFAVDELGYMWFRESVNPLVRDRPPFIRWFVFDPEGIFQTSVRLPHAWRGQLQRNSLTIGADFIIALERSEYSEETFVMVPLIRG